MTGEQLRTDIIAARKNLERVLLGKHMMHPIICGVGVHGRNEKILVYVRRRWHSGSQKELERDGYFGWPVQIVRLG